MKKISEGSAMVWLLLAKFMGVAPEQPNKSEKIHNSLPRSKDLEFPSC